MYSTINFGSLTNFVDEMNFDKVQMVFSGVASYTKFK
jgi:hypothetical protein